MTYPIIFFKGCEGCVLLLCFGLGLRCFVLKNSLLFEAFVTLLCMGCLLSCLSNEGLPE